MFIRNFCDSFANLPSIILGAVGVVAGGVSLLPIPMPAWLKIALKVVSVAAPAAGAIVSTVKFFKNKKADTAPKSIPELALMDDEITEEELLDSIDPQLLEDYDEAQEFVADEARYGKDRKIRLSRNKKFRPVSKKSDKKEKSSKKISKKAKSIKEVYPRLPGVGGTCEDIVRGKFDSQDYEVFKKAYDEFCNDWYKVKAMPTV